MAAAQGRKELLYTLLFALCVGLPYINYYEATFVLWSFAILVTLRRKYSFNFLGYVGYFAFILLVATLVGIFKQAEVKTYDFIRDITYLLKPILGLLAGYQICKPHLRNPINTLVYVGGFIATAHLLVILHAFIFLNVRNINDLRQFGGYFSDYEIYALIFLIFRDRFGIDMPQKRAKMLLILIGVSAFLYLARTNFLQFAILYMAMKGYMRLTTRSIAVIASVVALSVIGYAIIYNANPRRGAKGLEAFFYKIKVAPMEPFKSKVNADDWVDFNDNYRSYENILTIRQVSNKGTAAVIFGEGLGSSIDLKREVWLQTSMMRYIPFLHNGFMTVFLKSGLLGLFVYFLTIAFFLKRGRSDIPLVSEINLLLYGTGFFLIISNWVFLGFYNLFDTKTLLVGFLFAYRERLKKLHK